MPAPEHQEATVDELAASFDHLDPRLDHHVLDGVYARWATGCPVPHTEAHGGFSMIIKHADINEVEKNVGGFSSAGGVLHPPHSDRPPSIPIEFDPPEHTMYRALFMEVLSVPRVRDFDDQLAELADQIVGEYVNGTDLDFVDRVAVQIPIQAVARLLGCEPEVGRDFQAFGEEILRTFGTPEMAEPIGKFARLAQAEFTSRRSDPRDDYLTKLTTTEIDGRPLTDAELLNTMQSFVFAGFETTARTLATTVHHLAQHPEIQDRLRSEPELVPNVVEEGLRMFPPVHTMFRTAKCPVEVHGAEFDDGDRVALMYGPANRDADVFDAPNEFKPDRDNARRHVAFGAGPHFCAGAPLARAEMRHVLEKLTEYPNYELNGEPRFLPRLMMGQMMGISYLPLRFSD